MLSCNHNCESCFSSSSNDRTYFPNSILANGFNQNSCIKNLHIYDVWLPTNKISHLPQTHISLVAWQQAATQVYPWSNLLKTVLHHHYTTPMYKCQHVPQCNHLLNRPSKHCQLKWAFSRQSCLWSRFALNNMTWRTDNDEKRRDWVSLESFLTLKHKKFNCVFAYWWGAASSQCLLFSCQNKYCHWLCSFLQSASFSPPPSQHFSVQLSSYTQTQKIVFCQTFVEAMQQAHCHIACHF